MNDEPISHPDFTSASPWYHGVTRYQWLVLTIASLGWIFDVFEGQIFVASMNEAMPALLPAGEHANVAYFNNLTFGCFLLGGALGGILFGILSDRIGRARTMVYTILLYSAFTALSAFSQVWWHMAVLRFFVALGVGGEWAVASAMVAEVFPKRARAWSLAIFHASSLLGVYLAVAAGVFLVANPNIGWRWGFAIGVLPALLTIWVRMSLQEPQSRSPGAPRSRPPGRFVELFAPALIRRTLISVGLAAIGMATYWGVFIYGKDLLRRAAEAEHFEFLKRWEMLGLFLTATGGGIGLVCFGPICERIGRRAAFVWYHLGAFVAAVVLFQLLGRVSVLLVTLPIFGFLGTGMHAGYAVYFPEFFPTRLRGTGAGFAFNVGRVLAAPILFVSGWLQRQDGAGLSLENAATLLSGFYLLGAVLLVAAPETRGLDLPE